MFLYSTVSTLKPVVLVFYFVAREEVKRSINGEKENPVLKFETMQKKTREKEKNEWTRVFFSRKDRPRALFEIKKKKRALRFSHQTPPRDANENLKRTDRRNRRHDFPELKFV
jgi:hypothetical protein